MARLLPAVLAAAFAFARLSACAQANLVAPPACGFDEAQSRYFAAHPQARAAYDGLNQRLAAMPPLGQSLLAPTVTIPVVVHIIHAGGADNISDSQVISGLAQLNTDYQKLNADTSTTVALFQPIAANVGIQFRLAKKDPNGNCTTGITRRYAPAFIHDDLSNSVKAIDNWDTSRYLNIWLVSTIGPVGFRIITGYSSYPGVNPILDGFVIRHDYFGNQGTSTPARGMEHHITHEMAHCLGLLHTWGDTNSPSSGDCTGTDYVADTPPTDGNYGTCLLAYALCGATANVQNFMEYSSCRSMFTRGQKGRMLNALALSYPNLTTPANLLATGTNDGYVAPECAPVAAFAPVQGSSPFTCVNTPILLRDCSANFTAGGGALTYTWSAPGATFIGAASGQSVTLSYSSPGFYSVAETVRNSVGATNCIQTNFIRIEGPGGGEMAPLQQSFENPAFPNLFAAPTLRNYEARDTAQTNGNAAPISWQRQTALPAADGSAYLRVANRAYPIGTTTTLITPNISLAAMPGAAVLRFARAYALGSTTDNAELSICFSRDCGNTWSVPTILTAADLTTQGRLPNDGYVPTSAASWQDLSVAIPAQFQGSGLFKVRFQLVNGSTVSNDFFLDNLRVSGPLATKADALAQHGIAVYPNPLTRETAVHLKLAAATSVQLRLSDMPGRTVLRLPAKTYAAGPQAIALSTAGQALPAGVYVLHITLNTQTFTTKLAVD